MYGLINQHIDAVLGYVDPFHCPVYDALIDELADGCSANFRSKYRRYWAMNVAQLNPDFYEMYFRVLEDSHRAGVPPPLADLARDLYEVSTRRNGNRSVQFSFASKLVHTIDRHSPIYDSLVAGYYFFAPPIGWRPEDSIARYCEFHSFLVREYARIIADGLLDPAITAFRAQFTPAHFTDEKIIDTLLWAFVKHVWNGAAWREMLTFA